MSSLLENPRHIRSDSRLIVTAIRQNRLTVEEVKRHVAKAYDLLSEIDADSNARVFASLMAIIAAAAEFEKRLEDAGRPPVEIRTHRHGGVEIY